MSGYVYFIKCHDRIKIGYSEDPEKRLSKINCDAPYRCELLGFVNADDFPESELHDQFAAYRVHSEWFLAVPQITEFIGGVMAMVEAPVVRLDRFERAPVDAGAAPLKAWRYANKMTLEVAGAGVGCSKVQWFRLENGLRPITAEMAVKIEAVTGIKRIELREDIFGKLPERAA